MNSPSARSETNPLLAPWNTPYAAPPFSDIRPEHFRPAFEASFAAHEREIAAIRNDPEPPSFENTIVAMERAGRDLDRVSSVFFNLTSADTNDALQEIEREIAPVLARHYSAIHLDGALFARIAALYDQRGSLDLTAEQHRVLERYHTTFRRRGAGLDEAGKTRLAEITERLAVLGTQFAQNVLADERAYALVLDGEDDLAGLPDFLIDAAAQAAQERGLAGKHVITLSRSSIEPFLQYSARRDLREAAFQAWTSRGEGGGQTDNRAIIGEMVRLRAERARLLGYENFAAFRLDDTMAGSPEAALNLLNAVWAPAREQALREHAALQELVARDGGNFTIQPWDWRYYAERRRKAEFDLEESEIKPYLQLDKMIEAAFYTAERLFGLQFTERKDVSVYHPDVRVWDVKDEGGRHLGLFLGDYFARSGKRSGAWMNGFRGQHKLDGGERPIIVNVMNFAKSAPGTPTLLSFDDARTLFHEFGHALHALMSDVTYPSIAGTYVSRDFVEFPSQIYEHWLEQPEVLKRFALHYRTGAPMPEALIDRLLKARRFNQGFATVEYCASALVDMDFHLLADPGEIDVRAFESESLKRIGMPEAITMRHRPTHFTHVFTGDAYAAGYYSYLWSEVLDADGFEAFEEAGDIFDAETAKRLKEFVYSAGNRREPTEAYVAFRGRPPVQDALLRGRGLA
ncbi:M3 family metallopeptidase [Rhodoligotrophos defluvii]|uniref:M3 family metallopeptidase n=1 Tax=Rhodoligotrophos defluvii TaxID=2561934 RepID=UPI0010C9AEF1|nr:M3 family metallopeptidase [Rhodoligotrophos defluvii]